MISTHPVIPESSLLQTSCMMTEGVSAIMAIVDQFTSLELQQYSAFYPKNLRHYAEIQKSWMQDSTYFLGIDLGHKPDPTELADKILNTNHSQRFRAYYALRFPDRVTIDTDELKRYETALLRMHIDR